MSVEDLSSWQEAWQQMLHNRPLGISALPEHVFNVSPLGLQRVSESEIKVQRACRELEVEKVSCLDY